MLLLEEARQSFNCNKSISISQQNFMVDERFVVLGLISRLQIDSLDNVGEAYSRNDKSARTPQRKFNLDAYTWTLHRTTPWPTDHPSPMVQLDEAFQGTQKDLPVHKTVLAVNERDCGVAVAVVELEVTPPKWIDPDIWWGLF
jgi:hypothetical protein